MSTEYEIDTPPDLELLGGEPEQGEETDPEQEHEQEALDSVGQNEDENAEEGPASPPKRDQVIPRARFDEVNAKLHAAREEAEQFRAALAERAERAEQAQDSVDVDDLEDQYYEAIMSGDKDEAKKIRSRINADLYARAEATSAAVVSRQLAEQAEESQFQSVVNQAVTVYPFLDSESKAANKAAIDDVLSWRGMYEAQGHSKANALAMAVNKVGPYYHRPAPAEEDQPVDTRKQKALRLAAETAALQPPRVDDGVGTRAIPVSKEILGNQDKWDRASESERMRFLQ
jgi:hypothetical protein